MTLIMTLFGYLFDLFTDPLLRLFKALFGLNLGQYIDPFLDQNRVHFWTLLWTKPGYMPLVILVACNHGKHRISHYIVLLLCLYCRYSLILSWFALGLHRIVMEVEPYHRPQNSYFNNHLNPLMNRSHTHPMPYPTMPSHTTQRSTTRLLSVVIVWCQLVRGPGCSSPSS